MKPVDRLAILGLVMVGWGGALFFIKSPLPLWTTWLVGPMMWYLGFAFLVVWGLHRMFGLAALPEQVEQPEAASQSETVEALGGNFLEHGWEPIP
jgi:hypothetical protein